MVNVDIEMYSITLKPETLIYNNVVVKICNFNIIKSTKPVYFNNNFFYTFPFTSGTILSDVPLTDVILQYVDFLFNEGVIINGQLFLPYDDIMNLSNFVYDNETNTIQSIDQIDKWWCCYGNISKMDIINCLLSEQIKIKYLYKVGFSTLWTRLK